MSPGSASGRPRPIDQRSDQPRHRVPAARHGAEAILLDPISRAILASAARARRLAAEAPPTLDAPGHDRRGARLAASGWFGGLGLWAIALFLLGVE